MADTIYIPEDSAKKIVQLVVGADAAEDITLQLFANDLTIDDDTVIGDFTIVDTDDDANYVDKTLTMGSWNAPTFATPNGKITYAQQTWTWAGTTSWTCYGYLCKMATTGTLLWAVKFGAGKPFSAAGETLKVTPEFWGGKAA